MRQTPKIERMLSRSVIRLFKYWFSVTREEQLRRFKSHEKEPLKKWKLSPIDRESLDKWDDYTEAKEAMFFYTDTANPPWSIIKSHDKKRARLNCIKHFLYTLPYAKKNRRVIGKPDPLIVGSSTHVVNKSQHILGKSLHPDSRRGSGLIRTCSDGAGFARHYFDGFSGFRDHAFAVAIRWQGEALRLIHAEFAELSARRECMTVSSNGDLNDLGLAALDHRDDNFQTDQELSRWVGFSSCRQPGFNGVLAF